MQIPILAGTTIRDGKTWYIYHKNEVCARTNKDAREVFKISGMDGELLRVNEEIEVNIQPVDATELWVLGSVLLMN